MGICESEKQETESFSFSYIQRRSSFLTSYQHATPQFPLSSTFSISLSWLRHSLWCFGCVFCYEQGIQKRRVRLTILSATLRRKSKEMDRDNDWPSSFHYDYPGVINCNFKSDRPTQNFSNIYQSELRRETEFLCSSVRAFHKLSNYCTD